MVWVVVTLPTDRRKDELSGGSAGQRVHARGVKECELTRSVMLESIFSRPAVSCVTAQLSLWAFLLHLISPGV